MATNDFRNLVAWQRAHEFVLEVYRVTSGYPRQETFGLCSQFQRAAVSIAANLAEGYKRRGAGEKLRFYNISQGSLEECRYYILLSKDLKYVDVTTYECLNSKLESASRLINSYCERIAGKKKEEKQSPTSL